MFLIHSHPQSLVNWDANNPDCLLIVLKELIHLYKEYQERLLSNNSRMQFEYNSLCDTGKFDNIELLHGKKGVRYISYHFL